MAKRVKTPLVAPMASHFTFDDAAPRVARLDALLCALMYGNPAVMMMLFPVDGGGDDEVHAQRHIFVVTGELIALESGAAWLTAQWQRQRRRRWWHRSRGGQYRCCQHMDCEMAADNAEFTGSVRTMMHRTGTNVYRIPAHTARMCGFDEAADLLDNAAASVIMVREYVYNAQTRASMHVTADDDTNGGY